MADEVFSREHKVASQQLWLKPEDLTDDQKALKVVDKWKIIEAGTVEGELTCVNQFNGFKGTFTAAVVVKQGLAIGDVVDVRQGKTREFDTVTLIKG